MSEKLSERKNMSTFEASKLLRQVAEPRPVGDSVKAAISRAARRLGWSWNRAKDVWYADNRISISAAEIDALRSKTKEAAHDPILARLERLEAAMLQLDPEFYGEAAAVIRRAVDGFSHENKG